MTVLFGIESSGPIPSLALWCDGGIAQAFADESTRATPQLLPMLRALFQEAGIDYDGIDAYVLGVGPGRFTGLRVGMAFLQGLALPKQTPMVGVSSLQVLAAEALAASSEAVDHVVVLTNAFMGEVFVGIYDREGKAVVPDALAKPDALCLPFEGPWLAAGEGWDLYRTELADLLTKAKAIDSQSKPTAKRLVDLGAKAFERGETQSVLDVKPNYLRLANAWKKA